MAIKGLKNTSIHWLTATLPLNIREDFEKQAKQYARIIEGSGETQKGRPFPNNYTTAIDLQFGKLSWHHERSEMKICYNLTGAGIEEMYRVNATVLPTFKALRNLGANFTRIDLALDFPEGPDLSEIVQSAIDNPGATMARKITPYEQIDLDEEIRRFTTGVYIGSTKSARFLTVYNKAIEMKLPDQLLTRIEARNRKAKAQQTAIMLSDNGIAETTRTIIKTFADFPLGWWQSALSGPLSTMPPVGRKDTDTVKWLLETVAPVLEREIAANGGMESELYRTYARIIVNATTIERE